LTHYFNLFKSLIFSTFPLFPKKKIEDRAVFHFLQHLFGRVADVVDIFFHLVHNFRQGFGSANEVKKENRRQNPQQDETYGRYKKENL